MHPEQRPTEHPSEEYPQYPSPEGYPPYPQGYPVPPGYPSGGGSQEGYPAPGGYPPAPSGPETAGGYATAAGQPPVPGGYPYETGGYGPPAGYPPQHAYPPAAPQPGGYDPGGYDPTGQHPAVGGYPEAGQDTQAGGYPGYATGVQPPVPPPGPPTGEYRPTGEFQPTGEYARFKEGQAAAAAPAATAPAATRRAARVAGKQHANRRLRVAAGVILAATLMVGGGAYASQGNGSQPFAGLLAGDRETTTSAPAAVATPQPTAAPKPTQPPTTAAPTTTTPPETTKAPAGEEDEAEAAPASNRARAGVRPNADNTGVPAGVALRAHSGELNISEAGTTISGLDIDGCVGIGADNVTIRNSRIRCNGSFPVRLSDGVSGVLLEDVEIDGGGNPQSIAIADSDFTVRRADIHNVGDGPRLGDNTRVEFSFIHDLVAGGGSHNDGAQSTGGSNIVVRGNRIENPNGQTSAILIGADLGNINGAVVEGNWLDGGGYTVVAGADEGFEHSGIQIVNNIFGRGHLYGPMNIQDGVVWEGNRYADGEAITR